MRFISFISIFLLCFSSSAYSGLVIDITEGVDGALPIAIVPFKSSLANESEIPDIASIVRADLRRSGFFNPLASNELPARPDTKSAINFSRWKGSGLENLVVGNIDQGMDGRYLITFKMFDVYTKQQIVGYRFQSSITMLRSAAHKISDVIYEKLTGVRGDFDTKISYVVANQDNKSKKLYTLMVADSDGYNERIILRSYKPIMSPDWSPNGKRLTYVSFEQGRSVIYIQELRTGKRKVVTSYKGLNSAPKWSPDGKRLAVTLSKDGNTEIYIVYVDSGVLQRITRHYAIDTEPTWSPDGSSIMFTSNRGGKPQIYQVAVGPSGKLSFPKRITFDGKYNTRANFSPDGKWITFINQVEGSFRVALMNLDTGGVSILTESHLDESPSFSPNGKSIIYATILRGKGVLEVIPVDSTSSPHRLRVSVGDVREPAWSSFRNP